MGKQVIGFDFGEHSVKIAVTSNGKIKKCINLELPENVIKNGVIVSTEAMEAFLLKVAKENKISNKNVAMVLPSSLVVFRNLIMPFMTEQQLKYNLPFEFSDYLSEDKSKYYYDYMVEDIINGENGNPKEIRLYACAVAKSHIEMYKRVFKNTGFKLTVAIPTHIAIEKVLTSKEGPKDFGVVDIGHRLTSIYFFHKRRFDLERVVDIGLNKINEIIASEMGMDLEAAEAYSSTNRDNVMERDFITNFYDSLAIEIMKAVNFYNYNNRAANLQGLYICGGGSQVELLVKSIEDHVSIPLYSVGEYIHKTDDAPEVYLSAYGCTLTD